MDKIIHSLLIITLLIFNLASQHAKAETNLPDEDVRVYNNIVAKKTIKDPSGKKQHAWVIDFTGISTSSFQGPDEDVIYNKDGEPISCRPRNRGWHHSTEIGIEHLYFGWTELSSSDFDINAASSWEWGFSIFDFQTWNNRETFGISTSLLLSRSSYRMRDDDAFHLADDGDVIIDDVLKTRSTDPINYKKQRLIHWSWRVPVMMNFQTRHRWGHSPVRFSMGAEFELRHHIRSRAKVGGDRKYYLCRRSMNINPIGSSALMGIGTDDFMIFGRFLLTDYFEENTRNIQAQPFMVGINFFL